MNTYLLLITLLLLLFPSKGNTQDFPKEDSVKPVETQPIRKKNHILTIGIGTYNKPWVDLLAANQLSKYQKSIARKYIWPYYKDRNKHEKVNELRPIVSVDDVKTKLFNLLEIMNDENPKDVVVMIHILGHGEFDNNEYYLVCSDGNKISGAVIKRYLIDMANKGALVIVFLDTCHAGALFKDGDRFSINSSNGAIAFYASSQADQEADGFKKDVNIAPFTDIILETLANKNEEAFDGDMLTSYSLKHYVENRFEGKKQKPCIKLFPANKNFNIIQKAGKIKKISFYTGLSFGQPLGSAFGGLTLFRNCKVHGKIEAGASLLPERKANNMYLYKPDNSFSGGYNYTSSVTQPFVRLGAEFDLGKNWSLTPLVGLSFLRISGDPISDVGSNDGKGEKATATCLSSNVRLAWAPFEKKNWQIHATAGYDVGIGDTNYNVLRENDDVKKMAEYLKGFRGQLGIIYNF